MKNLKIGKKLLLTFGMIVVLFCLTVIVSIVSSQTTSVSFDNFYNNGYKVSNWTMDMRRIIQSVAKYVGYSTMTMDADASKKYIESAQAEMNLLEDNLEFLYENFSGDIKMLDQFNKIMSDASAAKEEVFNYAANLENTKAIEVFFNEYQPALVKANELLVQISEVAATNADETYQASKENMTGTTIVIIGLSVVVLLVTILLALYITRSLTTPIKELEAAANQMVRGDLNVTIHYESRDELGSLSNSMRSLSDTLKAIIGDIGQNMTLMGRGNFDVDSSIPAQYVGDFSDLLTAMREIIKRLSSTLAQIGQSSDQVASGAEQVSGGSQALSQGATEQASAVQQLAATVTEISNQVKTNASSAQQANQLANNTGNEMVRSNQQMQAMVAAMQEISASSGEIGKIIKTIEDIAFQTNILALNAAVEAARAGAAGKGFAVVADEVRNLASKSAEASKNTAILIEGSLRAVDNGTKIATDTAASLLEAVEGSKKVSETIDQISKASGEQAQAIVQVTQGIDQISSVVQTNSATAEQSAAASEELSSQAQVLQNLVAQFKLRHADQTNYAEEYVQS